MIDQNREIGAAGLDPAVFRLLHLMWGGLGFATFALAVALTALSTQFGPAVEVIDMPCLALVGLLVVWGGAFATGLPALINASLHASEPQQRTLLGIVVVAGLLARLVLFMSEPILEDDYKRYLWDGAVTAHAYNPYTLSPLSVIRTGESGELGSLAGQAGPILDSINHKSLTTIYPPVAQATFAIAHFFKPWSLDAWRTVLLLFDMGTLAIIIGMLSTTSRTPLWAALYWLNPLVLKEVFNSAHMEAIVLPFVMLSLALAGQRRNMSAILSLGVATGAKFWPVLLAPLLLRPLAGDWRRLVAACLIFGVLLALWLAPMMWTGLGETSGLAAYVEQWKTNSALLPLIETGAATALSSLGLTSTDAGMAARLLIACALGGLTVVLSREPIRGLEDLITRSSIVVAGLVVLSPAQYPWYTLWLAPFLAFRPYRAFLLLNATIPLYYMSFYFAARETYEIFSSYVVWVIWAPVWALAMWDMISERQRQCRSDHLAEPL